MAAMAKPVVAILGCGKRGTGKEGWAIGHAHAEGWLKANPHVTLCGVDISAENLAAFGEHFIVPASQLFSSTEALYRTLKPDFVSICTWPALHAPMALEAVSQGVKGIVCEKPLALDLEQMRAIRDACAHAGTRLAVAHQRRYEPMFQTARQQLHDGAIGKGPWTLEFRVGDGWDILSWTVHWFDMANYLLGATPISILAGGDVTGQRRYHHAVENASVLFAEYPGGHQAIFVTGPNGWGIYAHSTEGMLQIQDKVQVWTKSGYREPAMNTAEFPGGFARLMGEMLESAGTDRPILCGIENCFAATEMAYAAHEAIRTRRQVTLPLQTQFAPLEVLAHEPTPRTLGRVVLVADVHHLEPEFGLSGRDGLIKALESLRPASLRVIKLEERGLQVDDLADADLVVLYHTQKISTPSDRAALEPWVKSGKPLAVIHCGIGAYMDWPLYRQWIGHYWVWHGEDAPRFSGHPHEPCVIEALNPAFNVPWREAWLPKDEVYIDLGQASEVEMLAVAKRGDQVSPAAWRANDFRNVAVWAPGHRPDMWELESMRQGLAAIIQCTKQ